METGSAENESRGREYNRVKIRLTVLAMAADIIAMAFLAFSGLPVFMMSHVTPVTANPYLQFLLFGAATGLGLSIMHLPLDLYGGFILEHRYGLSNQNIFRWIFEKLKGTSVSLAIGIPVALAFYAFLTAAETLWWLYTGLFMILVSVILARLAPVLIFPLFYKFREIENDELKAAISGFMKEQNIPIKGIFSFNMSRDTRKANAGFTGLGKTKRIILSDTLIENFTEAEILTVFAHEVGHYLRRHIVKNLFSGTVFIFLSFYLCGLTYQATISAMGFSKVYDIAAIPVLLFYLTLFGLIMMPLTNYISRRFEVEADSFALESTGDSGSFISAMEKLAAMNLADREPHPIVEFLFYSHPSIARRISFARNFK